MRKQVEAIIKKAVPLAFLIFFFSLLFTTQFSFAQQSRGTQNSEDSLVGKHSAGIGAGQNLLFGDHGTLFENSLGFNLMHEYMASELFGVMTLIHFSSHSGLTSPTVDSYSIFGVNPNFKINLFYLDKLSLFTAIGLGYYMLSEEYNGQTASVSTFGINVGPGMDLRLSTHFKIGLLVNFYHIFEKSDPESATTTSTALDLGGAFLKIGFTAAYIF